MQEFENYKYVDKRLSEKLNKIKTQKNLESKNEESTKETKSLISKLHDKLEDNKNTEPLFDINGELIGSIEDGRIILEDKKVSNLRVQFDKSVD